jgi:hypothetical protein
MLAMIMAISVLADESAPVIKVTCELQAEDFAGNYLPEDSARVAQVLSRKVADSCRQKFAFVNWTYDGDTINQDTVDHELLLAISEEITSTGEQICLEWYAVVDTLKQPLNAIAHPILYDRNDPYWPTHDPDELLAKADGALNDIFQSIDFTYDIGFHYLSKIALADEVHLADTTVHLKQLVLPLEWSRLRIADSTVFRVKFSGVPPEGQDTILMEIHLSDNHPYSDSVMSRIQDFSCRDWHWQDANSWFVELKRVLGNRVEGSLAVYLLKFYPDNNWDTMGGLATSGPEEGGQQ